MPRADAAPAVIAAPMADASLTRGAVVGRAARTGRRGAARPRLPLRHGLALRTLPRHLTLSDLTKAPLDAGLFLLRYRRLA